MTDKTKIFRGSRLRRLAAATAALFLPLLPAGCGVPRPDALAAVRARGVLRVGATGDYKPMSFREPATGKHWGFDAELAEDLARDLGVKLEYVPTTWPTLMRDTLDRKFDLALCGITITPERQRRALMSRGYLGNGKTILCRAADASKYTSLAAVDRPEVRVMENPGGLNEKFARTRLPRATLIIHPVNEEIPGLIAAGKADVMITEIMEAAYYCSQDRRLAAPLLDAPFTRGELGALLPPGHETLRDRVNDFIVRERKSGRLDELKARHLHGRASRAEPGTPPTKPHRPALPAAASGMPTKEKFFTGPRAYVNRTFLPDTRNSLSGQLAAAAPGATMTLEFIDEMERVRRQTLPLSVAADGGFTLDFTTLSDTQATGFTVRDKDGGFPAWRIRRIDRDPGLPKFRPNFWQADWIVPYTAPGTPPRRGGTLYFAKEFDLDLSQVARAACQYVGSNNGTAYINGVDLGRTYGWATPKAADDVLPLLRHGKNVFGGDARIPHGTATFMGELTLIMKDGQVRHIGTGPDWRCSETLQPGWGKPDFDHSRWPAAFSCSRPPQLPYGETRYRNFAPVPRVKFAGTPRTWRGVAGTTIGFELVAPPVKLHPDASVWLRLMRNGREFYRMPLRIASTAENLRLTGQLSIPTTAQSRTYAVELESRDVAVTDPVGHVTIAGNGVPLPPLTAEVKPVHGVPTLHLNGRPRPMMLQRSAVNVRNDTSCYRFTTGLDREGVRLLEVNLRFSRLWRPDGGIDTDELDLHLQSALFYAPHSFLVLLLNTDAPEWYVKKFPGERFVSDRGAIQRVSYASQQYRRDAAAFLGRIVEFLKSRPYYHRIAGIGLDGGDDGQFMQWAGLGRKYVGDYSAPMRNYFHRHLRNRYGDIAGLNAAWRTEYPDFSAIAIPGVARRRGSEAHVILDPVKDRDIIEFNSAFSACVADLISDLATTVKQATGRTRLVGAYYGKIFSIAGILQWGEFDIERILNHPDIDYLIAVDYRERPVGRPHELAAPAASYRMHNKIFVDEADIRTYIAGAARWAKTDSLYEFTSQARKMFLKSWVNGMGMHWYDIHGGMFENPGLQRTIGNLRKIADAAPVRRAVPAEIALLADEKSFTFTTFGARRRFDLRQNSAFGYLGAPYDVWFLSDLGRPGFPEYKMYVFLNALAPTPEQRRAVDALKRDGKLLVFMHNSGYIDGASASAENTARLTGIGMTESGPIDLAMRFVPDRTSPLFRRVEKVLFAANGRAESAVVPDDPAARTFGEFLRDKRYRPLAYKRCGSWQSFYCALGTLPPELWRELARAAGVSFLVDDDPDVIIYPGDGLLGVHSKNGGVKKLRFPAPHTFTDAITGQVAAERTATPEFLLRPGETRIFRTDSVPKED